MSIPNRNPDAGSEEGPGAMVARLRERYVGVLSVETERVAARYPLRYVLAGGGSGESRLVTLAPGGVRDAGDRGATLFVPEEWDGAAQLLVVAREIAEPERRWGTACDRWQAYHGRPGSGVWFELVVEGARLGEWVLEGVLDFSNALARVETELCRHANADRGALARLAGRVDGHEIGEATCVGVDDRGMDLRCPAGVLRVRFSRRVSGVAEAKSEIDRVLEAGGRA